MDKQTVVKLEITGISEDGRGIGKQNGFVYFVTAAVPGDVVDIQIDRKKKSWAEGSIIRHEVLSEKRSAPFCPYFGTCGGCKWQHLSYASQLEYKQNFVKEALERIGLIKDPQPLPIIASDEITFYRNKLEFTFSDRGWITADEKNAGKPFAPALGFHMPGRFDKIVDVDVCFLQQDPSNEIRNEVRRFAQKFGLSFYNLKEQKGFLRNLIVRVTPDEELMVVMVFAQPSEQQIKQVMSHLKNSFPQISSLLYAVNLKGNDTLFDQEIILYSGNAFITERVEDFRFKVGAKSFYQTNSKQTARLYNLVKHFAALNGTEVVFDLYSGTGTIANFIARQARAVFGIEYVPEAVENAVENSAINYITNTTFLSGDMKDLLPGLTASNPPDLIITDPPRAGMHPEVVQLIAASPATQLIYISCNPSTQARDLLQLSHTFQVEKIQPVDMFPQTSHVENIVYARRR